MATILFPTDFSATANNAFLYALNLAKVFKTDLRLITLKTHLNGYADLQEDEFNQKVDLLKQTAKNAGFEDIKIRSSLEFGELVLTVLDIISKEKVHYIVMGTQGENNFDKKVFGSQTISVINNSPVPVLAIPNNVKFHPERKFAFATLFDKKENKALEEIIKISKEHKAHLDVIHIEKANPTIDTILARREWALNFPEIEVEIIKDEDPEMAILDFCDKNKIDVLGIVHRDLNIFERLFTKNFSSKLLTNANFALFVLREEHK